MEVKRLETLKTAAIFFFVASFLLLFHDISTSSNNHPPQTRPVPISKKHTEGHDHSHDLKVFVPPRVRVKNNSKMECPTLLEFLLPKKSWTNIDLQMRYLINNDVCSSYPCQMQDQRKGSKILIANLIQTGGENRNLRDAIRKSMPKEVLEKLGIRRIFLLARPDPDPKSRKDLKDRNFLKQLILENEEHQDLLIGDFLDTYKNLTYKTVMGLDWATKFCPQAKFILKHDDDILVDFYQLSDLLSKVLSENPPKNPPTLNINQNQISSHDDASKDGWGYLKNDPAHRFVTLLKKKLGPQSNDTRVIMGCYLSRYVNREKSHKFYVSYEEYPNETWPMYSLGLGYITTVDTARDLVKMSRTVPFFWIEDVYTTGFLREKAGIEFISMETLYTGSPNELVCCLSESLADLNRLDLQLDRDIEKGREMMGKGQEDNAKETVSSNFLHPKWCHFLLGQASSDLTMYTKFQTHAKFCYESKLCDRVESREKQVRMCNGALS